jgi:CO/xanthine dehydrogenase Mo-binding subunit
MGAKYFGAAVRRLEDPRFLRGEGRFVDDVTLPGVLHAAFLRSPHAHATIVSIRTDAAKTKPGVVAVFAHADLARWMKPLPLFGTAPPGLAAAVKFRPRSTRSRRSAFAMSARSWPWWWPTTAAGPRTPSRRSRSSTRRDRRRWTC